MYEYNITIISVHDGDTFRGNVDLGFGVWIFDVSFRLNRINAPELSSTNPAGRLSRDTLRDLLPIDHRAIVKTQKDKTEKYGRMLADVYVDGICINDKLVSEGFAKYWDGHGPRP